MGNSPEHTLSSEALGGLRLTRQRKVVYEVLLDDRDHPTASEVFERAKAKMPTISLATVYNCLETLTQVGAVKQVNVDREASRYCPNLMQHAHFFCTECEDVTDILLESDCRAESPWNLPNGTKLKEIEVTMKGVCPQCREKSVQTQN